MSHRKRLGAFSAVLSAFAALVCLAASGPPAHARPTDVRLVSSGSGAVTFEVTVPAAKLVSAEGGEVTVSIDGYGTFSPPGAPLIPGTTFRVAVPASGEPRLSYSVLEEDNLGALRLSRMPGERIVQDEDGMQVSERYYPSDPWRGGEYPPVAEAGAASFMGRGRVLPIRVNPLRIDGNGAHLVRKLSITVSFDRSAARAAAAASSALPLSGAWKRLYDDLLVNPGDVGVFLKPLAATAARSAPGDGAKRLKILVPETGLYALRADSLIAAGLSPGLAPDEIALRQYYYDEARADLARPVDVPILIVKDASTAPGVFEGADAIVFYALGIKDDADALDLDAIYTDDNIVWLEEQSAGVSMPASAIMEPVPGNPVSSFRARSMERKDTYFSENIVAGTFDYCFVKGPALKDATLPIQIANPASSGTFTITLRAQGGDVTGLSHGLSFSVTNSNGSHTLGSGVIAGKETKTFTLSGSASWLVNGSNELAVTCSADYMYLVHEYSIEYPALFVAANNALALTLPAAVDVQTAIITGFTVNRGYLIDVTDPRHPVHETLEAGDFTPDGSAYRLALNVSGDTERHLIVLGAGAGSGLPMSGVSVDTPSELRGTAGSHNVIAVCHASFMQRFGEYVSRRAAEGYRIVTADVADVYDEFNGGRPSASAVKRFIKYGVDHWGVEFVVIVGDGSEDHKRLMIGNPPDARGSGPDFVPPFTYAVSVSGQLNDEIVSTDKWYAFLDEDPLTAASAPAGAAAPGAPLLHGYPDVFIGRIPVGSDLELRAVLSKIIRYEDAKVGDSWRRRIALYADDAWSGGGTDYRYRSYEGEFEWSTDTCGAIIERALPGGFDVQRCFLSHWTNGAHTIDESGPAVLSRAMDSTRTYFTPYLIRQLNRGCLFFMFQGHANRSVTTTEKAFATFLQYDDLDSLRSPLPHVFIGIGCHLSDFAPEGEFTAGLFDGPNGDCLSEQLLFKPGAGAAATYASDGFEYLSQNADLAETIHRALFANPPADTVEPASEYTGAHWILSEAIAKGEIEEIDRSYGGLDQILRYIILGDPLLRIDPGPPLMRLEADWGGGYEPLASDTLQARNGTNEAHLRLDVSDVVAVGHPALTVNGVDWTDSLTVTPLVDADKTYPRSYRADVRYTVDPRDELLVFKVFTPAGREAGVIELPIVTTIRLFYNSYEIVPPVESPPTGTFTLVVDFPCYLSAPPELSIDGLPQHDVLFTVADPANHPLRWRAAFDRTLPSGTRVFTIRAGDFSRDFVFDVTGNELVANAYNFPNPFATATNFIYTLNLPIDAGRIDIYSVSGVLVRRLELPPGELDAASDNRHPHALLWDGRDRAGDEVANGTYIYVASFERGGRSIEIKGKAVKLE